MARAPHRLFAGRGIALPGPGITIVTIVAAFAIGIAAGWGTSLIAGAFSAPSPSASPSAEPSPSPSITPTGDVSVPPMDPVVREIDADDRAAGLRTLDFPYRGDGTFSTAPAPPLPSSPGTGIVEYVRIDVEDGLQMTNGTLSTFVMTTLNDPQGWGQEGPTTYVQTDGAPDVRVVFASPYTAAALCPTPHEPAPLTPASTPSTSPTPTGPAQGIAVQCAPQGAIVVSVYDWIQGLDPYGADRTGARQYLLGHALGHVLGNPDVECTTGVADVMVDQRALPKACTPNPWPFPAKD